MSSVPSGKGFVSTPPQSCKSAAARRRAAEVMQRGLPEVGHRVIITKWAMEGQPRPLSGEVTEHRSELDRDKERRSFKVKYDADDAECWHEADEEWQDAEENGGCDRGWVEVNDRCAITLQLLTDPAKTTKCRHMARCNMEALAAEHSRQCPVCRATRTVVPRHM